MYSHMVTRREVDSTFMIFFKFDMSISIKRKIVSEDCPKCCPCCDVSVPSFSHMDFCL